DQTIAALAQPSHALLIECATAEARQIPFRGRLLLVDTGVRHELAAGALNRRRSECEAAGARLRVELPERQWAGAWPVAGAARASPARDGVARCWCWWNASGRPVSPPEFAARSRAPTGASRPSPSCGRRAACGVNRSAEAPLRVRLGSLCWCWPGWRNR